MREGPWEKGALTLRYSKYCRRCLNRMGLGDFGDYCWNCGWEQAKDERKKFSRRKR